MRTVAWEVNCGYQRSQPALCREPSTAELNDCICTPLVSRAEAEAAIEAARAEVPRELQILVRGCVSAGVMSATIHNVLTPAQRKACGLPEEP